MTKDPDSSRKAGLADLSGLDNPERTHLLSIVDKFRELGVSEDISLPQLVVVGDQSSGKSSLLEGLTGLAFPVAGDLCTRFATQIVLRRTGANEGGTVKISIIPGPSASLNEEEKKKLTGFGTNIAEADFNADEFAKTMNEAAIYMGLPSVEEKSISNLDKRFSDDVLKIEIAGPSHRHLSVVDVPGLFHNPTPQQTEEDKIIVANLIKKYIDDERTINIPVMDAQCNLANQDVFRMVREADPAGLRTVGVITKCDRVQAGNEDAVIKIASNDSIKLTHGWFLVKNRSPKEIADGVTVEQRHIREKNFFEQAPWNTMKKDRTGIDALKSFLGQILYSHIKAEFPKLMKELKASIDTACKERDDLGPARKTAVDQRQFLTKVTLSYQDFLNNSLLGRYESKLTGRNPLKLRMLIQNLNETFAKDIRLRGHTWRFRTPDGTEDSEFPAYDDEEELSQGKVAKKNIYNWIKRAYQEWRGSELPGTVNPAVLEGLFRQQTENWESIASSYLESVVGTVKDFNTALLLKVVGNPTMRSRLAITMEETFQRAIPDARLELEKIIQDERGGILQTVNHYFADNLAAARRERVICRLKKAGVVEGVNRYPNHSLDFNQILGASHLSNEDQAANDIHDILKAYYKVVMKRFIDTVVLQVVERHFLGRDGPLRFFSVEYIGGLSDAELSSIAAEDYATSISRLELDARIERLQKALDIANNDGAMR